MQCDLLVVGGGMAGLTAAVEAAEMGLAVVIAEREHYLGGRVIQMHRYFPKMCPPVCGLEINFRRVRNSPKVTVLTGATVRSVEGDPGRMHAQVDLEPRFINDRCTACGDCATACSIELPDPFNFALTKTKAVRLPCELAFPHRYVLDERAVSDPRMSQLASICKPGAIDLKMQTERLQIDCQAVIWTTGWKPYDAAKLPEYGFGVYPNVVTNMMFERMAALGEIRRPSDGAPPGKVAFIQCAGSRDQNHLPYCSAVCCMASLKQVRYLREQKPDVEVHVFFIDARTPGRWEDFYREVQTQPRTFLHRGKVGRIESAPGEGLTLRAEDTMAGRLTAVTVDMAVLAVGMVPAGALEADLPDGARDEFGFVNGRIAGLISAGVASAPMDVAGTVRSATGAVASALKFVKRAG